VARKRPTASNGVPLTQPIASNVVPLTQPIASNVVPLTQHADGPAPPAAWAALTCAEAHALRRSAPLTPNQFAALRRRAELGISPLDRG